MKAKNCPFRELVGSLMGLTISTYPDISNAVRAVARDCSAPKDIHWKATLGILEYVNAILMLLLVSVLHFREGQ